MANLDEVLSGKAPEKTETKVEVTPKAEVPEEPKAERQRDEAGKFVKGEEIATPPVAKAPTPEKRAPENADSEPLDPKAKAFYAMSKDDRRKRQEAEQRNVVLEQRLAALSQPKMPDVLTDPEGFAKRQQEAILNGQWQTILDTSEIAARDKYGDEVVNEAQAIFKEQAQSNPALWHTLEQQRQHPYRWVVNWAKQQKLLTKMGDDPDAYIESQVTERLSKRETELKAQFEASRQPTPPPSLASASGGRTTSEPTHEGRKSFDKIFVRR